MTRQKYHFHEFISITGPSHRPDQTFHAMNLALA